jgi:hypothetical protein
MKTLLFEFENMGEQSRKMKELIRAFSRAGANVVSSDVAKTTTRRAGVTFRNVSLTFADGQRVVLAVKSTGDVFEVRVNDKVTPIKNQDDHSKAVVEIAAKMDVGRSAFQKALAKARVPLPHAPRVSRATLIKAKEERRDGLVEAVGLARKELQELTAA